MEYNKGDEKLAIKGRATAGTTISIINADTRDVLAEDIKVKKGKWKVKIKNVDSNLENITAISSNDCALDQAIDMKDHDDDHKDRKHDHDRKDRHDDDDHKDRHDDDNDRNKRHHKK
jgi:hypothetical protein